MKKILLIIIQSITSFFALLFVIFNARLLFSGEINAYGDPVFGYIQAILKILMWAILIVLSIISIIYLVGKKKKLKITLVFTAIYYLALGISLFLILICENGSQPLYYLIPSLLIPFLNGILTTLELVKK